MSDQDQTSNSAASSEAPSELSLLKQRARVMGIVFSNNIGIDALREKIRAKLNDDEDTATGEVIEEADTDGSEDAPGIGAASATVETSSLGANADPAFIAAPVASSTSVEAPVAARNPIEPVMAEPEPPKKVKKLTVRQRLIKEKMRLIRCKIVNLDPKKKDLPGEIFTFANEYLGTVRKFIPYGEVTEDGWHIPYVIYKQLQDRKFLNITTTKDRRSGHIQTKTQWAKEFAIEVLPNLTQEEINRLAVAQTAAGSLDG